MDSAIAGTLAYSDIEEDFFRAGDEMSVARSEDAPDVAATPARRSVWSRLFERTLRLPSESDFVAAPVQPRSKSEPPVQEDDDWEWKIAIARARHATQPGI